jgi:hypothetical protein
MKNLLFSVLFFAVMGLVRGAQAEMIEVIRPALIVKKINGKVTKIAAAKVGQRFNAIGKNDSGKFYKIEVNNTEAFIELEAVKVIEAKGKTADTVAEKVVDTSVSDLPYYELGAVVDPELGLGGDAGFLYGVASTKRLVFDFGVHGTVFPFTVGGVKTLLVAAIIRLDMGSSLVVSPEFAYNLSLVSGGTFAVSDHGFRSGLLFGIPLGESFKLQGGARFVVVGSKIKASYLVGLRSYF